MSQSISRKLASIEKTETLNRVRARTTREENTVNAIQDNPFFNVIFSDNLSLEEKVENVTKILEFTNNKDEDRIKVQQFDNFKEYLQSISEEMSKQRIEMTDTEVFAELQKVYSDFNDDLNDFIEKINPLTEITDALYALRQSGETRNALAQIKADKEWVLSKEDEKGKLKVEIAALEKQLADLDKNNQILAQDKSFFWFWKNQSFIARKD